MKQTAAIPLIFESHPSSYTGFKFITLIEYNKQKLLTIVDNVTEHAINCYVLDYTNCDIVSSEQIIEAANLWYQTDRAVPISIYLSTHNLTAIGSKLYRVLNIEFVTRLIGPAPSYQFKSTHGIKRRRRKPIANVEIIQSDLN